jgi:eukaryotic-like serine/threonine-protein kinase
MAFTLQVFYHNPQMAKISTDTKKDLFTHIGIVFCFFLSLFLLFFFVYLPWSTGHGKEIVVPKIEGLSIEKATDLLDDNDLAVEVSDCVFVAGASPYMVLSHYPKAGSKVKEDRKIYVTITAGQAPLVKMPKITELSLHSAEMQLKQVGLLKGQITFKPDPAENSVLEQNFNGNAIAPGTSIPKGSMVDLVVGNGIGSSQIAVPNVMAKPYDEAELIIRGSGLELGTVIYDETAKQPAGTIIRQNPQASEKQIIEGTFIDLWVAGPEPK